MRASVSCAVYSRWVCEDVRCHADRRAVRCVVRSSLAELGLGRFVYVLTYTLGCLVAWAQDVMRTCGRASGWVSGGRWVSGGQRVSGSVIGGGGGRSAGAGLGLLVAGRVSTMTGSGWVRSLDCSRRLLRASRGDVRMRARPRRKRTLQANKIKHLSSSSSNVVAGRGWAGRAERTCARKDASSADKNDTDVVDRQRMMKK